MSVQENLPWRGVFRDLPREHGFEPLRVEGTLPEQLRGVLYRCGPARFSIGGEPYLHWFDADGAVAAVRFEGSRVDAAVRTVATRWLRREQAANRQLYRSYAQLGRGWRRWLTLPKNPANISVMPFDGQVLALWEAGLPISLDPATLETRGETNLGGRIGPTFSAHPHRVGKTLFNFGVHYGAKFSIDLYRFEREITRVASVPLPRPTIIHDFIVTAKHAVFFCAPVRLRLARLLAGMGSFDSNLAWEPEHGTEVIVIPLANPGKPVRFTVPPFFQWHFVNAWEEGDTLVVDYLPYDDFETNAWFGRAPYEPARQPPPSRYARARLDLKAKRMDVDVLSEVSLDFPAIHPEAAGRPHDQVWLLDLQDSIPPSLARFDTKRRTLRRVPLGDNTFPSEAVVVPAMVGSDGWVLSLVYDGERDASYVAVIDGARPEDGPVARLWFDHAIPFLFHGAWAQ
ncbi:MAG TPA: carotenoid oxygenase family protein [Thermoanaerobaculia bacterium]|nr:carotenoid oxygenase family protein [Thermoanaerobaculia bacterium]